MFLSQDNQASIVASIRLGRRLGTSKCIDCVYHGKEKLVVGCQALQDLEEDVASRADHEVDGGANDGKKEIDVVLNDMGINVGD